MPNAGAEEQLRVTVSVPGVNWRPTRFSESELHRHACSLCHLVPQSTLLLPCSHALCDSCHMGSAQDGAGACPLDWEPFEEADCQRIMLHARKANSLKAFCWNRVHGCDYVGALPDVLRHFEQECGFHVVPCPRCGDDVMHKNLPMHYKAECSPSSPPMNLGPPEAAHGALSAVAELKSLLARQQEHELPTLQSGVKEILERTDKQSLQLQEMSHELTDTERRLNGELKRVAKELSASFTEHDEPHHQSQTDEMPEMSDIEGSSARENAQEPSAQMPWRLEQKHILRKLEIIANESFAFLQDRRRMASGAENGPSVVCELVANPRISEIEDRLYVSPRRNRLSNNRCYRLNVRWTERMFSGYCSSWDVMATASSWHTWNTHLTVAVGVASFGEYFQLHFRWHGTLGAPYRVPHVTVTALHPVSTKRLPLNKLHSPRRFALSADEHADTFGLRLETLKEEGFFASAQLLRFDVSVED